MILNALYGCSPHLDPRRRTPHFRGGSVTVMNSNLIPNSVNIVIGDSLYELKFRVEMNAEARAHPLMEIDQGHEVSLVMGDKMRLRAGISNCFWGLTLIRVRLLAAVA
jgi:hypothetical protein